LTKRPKVKNPKLPITKNRNVSSIKKSMARYLKSSLLKNDGGKGNTIKVL
tara:strand:+ start:115 stop:264 length:150 start_codon:yes stop_codon:yes gene_type:complete